jgi:hypothetical protein
MPNVIRLNVAAPALTDSEYDHPVFPLDLRSVVLQKPLRLEIFRIRPWPDVIKIFAAVIY